jgi:hypothetical protein
VNHRQLSYCSKTPASPTPGLLGAVTKGFCATGKSIALVVLSHAALVLGLMAHAAKAEAVINCRSGVIGATGLLTLKDPLVGGMLRFVLGQGGWTC